MIYDEFFTRDAIQLMLKAWPWGMRGICKALGIKQVALTKFLEKRENLQVFDRATLYRALQVSQARPDECSIDVPHFGGAYVFNGDAKDEVVYGLYEALSHGGDLLLSCEVVPSTGYADTYRRFLVFSTFIGPPSIIVFQRVGKNTKFLESDSPLINFSGKLAVEPDLYQRVVMAADCGFAHPLFAATAAHQISSKWNKLIDRLLEKYGRSAELCQYQPLSDPRVSKGRKQR